MSGHTEGKWQWYWRYDEELEEAECGVFAESRMGHAYAIARCPRYQKQAQWEADAHLIVAAPEYDALAREYVAYWLRDGGCGNCGGVPHSTTCHVGRFQELIAKAEGK